MSGLPTSFSADNQADDGQSSNSTGQPARSIEKFPPPGEKARIDRYSFNDKLFSGNHFEAFSIKIGDPKWTKEYFALKYVQANFAGLISKVAADMLFSEPVKIDTDDGDQDFINGLVEQNELHTQFYESALGNSKHGDAIFKIRSGLLHPGSETPTIIIEDITPAIYFPQLNQSNVREIPRVTDLAWVMNIGKEKYLRKEVHEPGKVSNELWLMKGDEVQNQIQWDAAKTLLNDDSEETVQTKIKQSLIVHIPNWKDGSTYFGYDDYADLTSLFYAINNRMTKGENILDKHSDPILALPEGVLDEDGKVRKESFHMFEIPSDGANTPVKPEYITWNASLEPAFKQIDKLVEFLYMFSETSPDAFGMGQGQSDSGRALKYKLMRTIAKIARKKLYYDSAIKKVLFIAQEFAKANGIPLEDGTTIKKDPVMPEIIWSDGLPIDDREVIENEEIRLASGTQTVVDAIKNIDNIDDEAAQAKYAAILAEEAVTVPTTAPATTTGNNDLNATGAAQKQATAGATTGTTVGNLRARKDIAQTKLPPIAVPKIQRIPK